MLHYVKNNYLFILIIYYHMLIIQITIYNVLTFNALNAHKFVVYKNIKIFIKYT